MEFNLNIFIIRVPRDFEPQLRFSIASCNSLNCKADKSKLNCVFRLLEVCGSSRTCKDKLMKLYAQVIELCSRSSNRDFQADELQIDSMIEISRVQSVISNMDI
jgi:hypothetical protein